MTIRQDNLYLKIAIISSAPSRETNEEILLLAEARRKIMSDIEFDSVMKTLIMKLQKLAKEQIRKERMSLKRERGLSPRMAALLIDLKKDYENIESRRQYLNEQLTVLQQRNDLSELTQQVLFNSQQGLQDGSMTIDELIEYMMTWMQKIADRQSLSEGEIKVRKVFNQSVFTLPGYS